MHKLFHNTDKTIEKESFLFLIFLRRAYQYKVINLTICLNQHCKKSLIRTYVQNKAFEKRENNATYLARLKPDIVSICKKILTVWILIR